MPGSRSYSISTVGCNFHCSFCQNWDISKSREIDTLADQASPEKIARVAEELDCRSVAYTYNDPVIFHEYAIDVAKACRERNIRSVAVTAGYISPEPRKEFFQYMDAANVDLKAFSERFYHKQCAGHLQPVLDTLVYLREETNVWLEITTLLIPGQNDSNEELDALSLQAVSISYRDAGKGDERRLDLDTLADIYNIEIHGRHTALGDALVAADARGVTVRGVMDTGASGWFPYRDSETLINALPPGSVVTDDDEIAQRMADWQPPDLSDRVRPGSVRDKYVRLVSSAHEGCVL